MSKDLLTRVSRCIAQYGETQGITTSWWRIAHDAAACFVAAIPTEDHAKGISAYLNSQVRLVTWVIRPIRPGGPWSVMVTCGT